MSEEAGRPATLRDGSSSCTSVTSFCSAPFPLRMHLAGIDKVDAVEAFKHYYWTLMQVRTFPTSGVLISTVSVFSQPHEAHIHSFASRTAWGDGSFVTPPAAHPSAAGETCALSTVARCIQGYVSYAIIHHIVSAVACCALTHARCQPTTQDACCCR
jgi:hypothetical protein